MFDKVPYGVKVRVRGKSGVGYKADVCISYNRFLPFVNLWTPISSRKSAWTSYVFETLEEAQDAALASYKGWIDYYKRDEENKRMLKAVPNGNVWEHP